MKFTDLSSSQRSMLAMLCTGQSFDTNELAKGVTPKCGPGVAAHMLCAMRDAGLVFSNQKGSTEQYAQWKASTYGKAVFESRPVDVPTPVAVDPLDLPPSKRPKPFRVLQVSDSGIRLFDTKFADLEQADRFARTSISGAASDVMNYVVTLHKSMRYVEPVAAQVQVEDL